MEPVNCSQVPDVLQTECSHVCTSCKKPMICACLVPDFHFVVLASVCTSGLHVKGCSTCEHCSSQYQLFFFYSFYSFYSFIDYDFFKEKLGKTKVIFKVTKLNSGTGHISVKRGSCVCVCRSSCCKYF